MHTCMPTQTTICYHCRKSRTSKKQHFVLDGFSEDYIRSENGNHFINIFSEVHSPYFQELRGAAELRSGCVKLTSKTVIYLLK